MRMAALGDPQEMDAAESQLQWLGETSYLRLLTGSRVKIAFVWSREVAFLYTIKSCRLGRIPVLI